MTDRNKSDLTSVMGEVAMRHASNGECCSEAVVHAAIELLAPETPDEVVAMVRGLCGGMGAGKATCGVFTGGAVALGLIANTAKGTVDKKQLKQMALHYEELLSEEAGGQICEELKKKMGIRNWNGSQCRKLTRRGAELVAEMVLDQGIVTE